MKFVYFFILVIISFGLKAKLNEEEFKKNSDKYGNKTANLMELKKISKDAKLDNGYLLQVPDIFPISHDEMVKFLDKVYFEIENNWVSFQEAQKKGRKDFLEEGARVFLENISHILNNYFKNNKFSTIALEEFLANKKDKLLMVRSTGKEDQKELSNAGGNESVSSLKANIDDINDAIETVLTSYFSPKSIIQRLLENDSTVFTQPPFMSVLVQEMIGEYDGNIPTSGVMYSREAESFTPNLTHIQSTFGHNDAVVNGFLRPDNFLIYKKMVIPSIVKKDKRLAPGPKGLIWKNNAAVLAKRSSLDRKAVLDLAQAADIIQKYYDDHSMDIEFVVLNDTINLVQARPLEKAKTNPSYIKQEYLEKIKQEDIHKDLSFIGTAGGEAQIITNRSQIIESPTLREALLTYLTLQNKRHLKAVLVAELAPSTSHEATEFRKFGVITLVSPSLSRNTKYPLLIDPQRGLWLSFDGDENILEKGFYHHPLRPTITVNQEWQDDNIGWPEKLVPKPEHENLSITQLIEKLAIEDTTDAILYKAYRILARTKTVTNPDLMRYLKILSNNMLAVINLLKKVSYENRLERLFLISVLESLFFANNDKDILSAPSLISLLKGQEIDDNFIKELNISDIPYRGHIAVYGRLGNLALTPQLKQQWNSFLSNLANKPKEKQNSFAKMFLTLGQLDLFPIWLNNIFYKNQDLDSLLNDYEKNVDYLKEIKALIDDIKNYNFAGFEKVDGFDKRFNGFLGIISPLKKGGQLFDNFNQAPKLSKIAILNGMRILVEKFDLSIKALKGSKEYSDEVKRVERFKLMTMEYFILMDQWLSLGNVSEALKTQTPSVFMPELDSRFPISLKNYLSKIKATINDSPIEKNQTTPNPDFNVAGVAFGSGGANLDRGWRGPRLEDMFSLCHQNLLMIVATLGKEIGATDFAESELLKEVLIKVQGIRIRRVNKAFLLGVDINKDELIYFYNVPLRNHSSTFQIHYDPKDTSVKINFQFIGEARDRWNVFANLMVTFFPKIGLKLIKGPYIDKEAGLLNFGVKLTSQEQVENYFKILQIMLVNSSRNRTLNLIINDMINFIEQSIKSDKDKEILKVYANNFLYIPASLMINYENMKFILEQDKDIIINNPYLLGVLLRKSFHNMDSFKMLLYAMPNNSWIDPSYLKTNDIGQNFLHHLSKDKEMATLLIKKIPQLITDERIAKDFNGETGLNFACSQGYSIEIIKLLIEHSPQLIKFNPYYIASHKLTILHFVARDGLREIAPLLIEKAPWLATDENFAKDLDGKTPLDHAFAHDNWDIVKLLIEKAPNLLKISKTPEDLIKKDINYLM